MSDRTSVHNSYFTIRLDFHIFVSKYTCDTTEISNCDYDFIEEKQTSRSNKNTIKQQQDGQ